MLDFWTFRGRDSGWGTAHVTKKSSPKLGWSLPAKHITQVFSFGCPGNSWVTQVQLQTLLNLPKSTTLHLLPMPTWALPLSRLEVTQLYAPLKLGSPSQRKAQALTGISAVSYQLAAHLASLANSKKEISEDRGWWDCSFWQQPMCFRCTFITGVTVGAGHLTVTPQLTFCMDTTTISAFVSSIL